MGDADSESVARCLTATLGGDFYVDPQSYVVANDPVDGTIVGRTPLPGSGVDNTITFRAGGRRQIVVPMRNAELVALAILRVEESLPQQVLDHTDADHAQFYTAVAALDHGDVDHLQQMVDADRTLPPARGYLDESYPHVGFRGATLLRHVAGDPIRTRLPSNIVQLATLLIDAGADVGATTLEGRGVLSLSSRSSQLRWEGIRSEMIELLVRAGQTSTRREARFSTTPSAIQGIWNSAKDSTRLGRISICASPLGSDSSSRWRDSLTQMAPSPRTQSAPIAHCGRANWIGPTPWRKRSASLHSMANWTLSTCCWHAVLTLTG
jgi:hypothetical protein